MSHSQSNGSAVTSSVSLPRYSNGCTTPTSDGEAGVSESSTVSEEETIPSPVTTDDETTQEVPARTRKSCRHREDHYDFKIELGSMRTQIKQLQRELATEREGVLTFRKKLTQTNKEKLERVSKFNEEASELRSENASLLAQLEKQGEYTTQMEYEVTKIKKQLQQEKRLAEDKETHDQKTLHELEERLKDSVAKCVKLDEELSNNKRAAAAEIHDFKQTIDNRDKIISQTCQEQQILQTEKTKLQEFIHQQEGTIMEQQEKLHAIDTEVHNSKDHLRTTTGELERAKTSEERQSKELEGLRLKCKELSESIEAERAAHLESKFNAEIVQLKMKDLENSLDDQKESNNELQSSVDKLNAQLRDMETAYADERNEHKNTQAKLEKCDKEYTMSQRQLQTELSDKRSLVSNLKRQLDMHQTNVDELKSELGKAKKRQLYLEETYGGSMRELELLLVNFDLSGSNHGEKLEEGKSVAHTVVLETLRHTLTLYKRKLENSAEEITKLRAEGETLSKEAASYKDMLWTKEKALEETQSILNLSNKELEKIRTDSSELEARLATMKVDTESIKHDSHLMRSKCESLQNEITDIKMRNLQENEEKMRFMHALYQRVMVGSEVKLQRSPSEKLQALEKFTWTDLSAMLLEQVVGMLAELTHIKDRAHRHEDASLKKECYIENLRRDHEQQLGNMAATIEKNVRQWQDEKKQLEEHYAELMAEHQCKQQAFEKKSEEAWDKIRNTKEIVHQLEVECADMKGKVTILQKHNSSLLCAVALISGAYYPLLARSKQLAKQRTLLEDQLIRYEKFKAQTCVLLQLLTSEGSATRQSPDRRTYKMLLKFRKAVLTVMAANRFRKFKNGGHHVFTFSDYDNSQGVVCMGSLKRSTSPRGSPVMSEMPDGIIGEPDIMDWLSNKELIPAIMSCTEEAVDAVKRLSKKESGIRPGFLLSAARTSFKKLVGRLETLYPPCLIDSRMSPHKERYSLVKQLGRGLYETMIRSELESKVVVLPTQHVFTSLQEKVLEFINTMHSGEVERKSLKQKVASLMTTTGELRRYEDATKQLEVEAHNLKSKINRMVPKEKFEGVVCELNLTLSREKQAQEILNEQSAQLRELSRRLDEESKERHHKDQTLQQAAQSVKDSQSEIISKEELIQQLTKHVAQLENEREDLHDNIFDAEQALRTAAHDRDSLSNYIRTLTSTFEKCRGDIVKTDISKILLSKDLFPTGKAGPDLLACQAMVNSFVDSLRSIYNHIAGLGDEISSHKTHIARLKDELAAACKRQMGPGSAEQDYGCYDKLESTRLHNPIEASTPHFDRTSERNDAEYGLRNETEHSDGNSRPSRNAPRAKKYSSSPRRAPTGQEYSSGNTFKTPTVTSRSKYSTDGRSSRR